MGRRSAKQAREQEQRDELLSAYIDGQLGAEERARLEAQLAIDPALRAELDALRRTVALVRDLPTVAVPRNFILPQTAATTRRQEVRTGMAGRQPRRARPRRAWVAPLLTAATALASLLFVVTLAGDLLLFAPQWMASAPEEELPQMALEPSLVTEEVEAELEAEVEVEKAEEAASATTSLPEPTEAPSEPMPEAPAAAEVEEAVPTATALPMATETPPTRLAEAPAEESTTLEGDHTAEPAEEAETAPPAGSGGQMEEPTAPAPLASPPVTGEEDAAVAPTVSPTATPEARADSAEPPQGLEAEATPSQVEAQGTEIPEVEREMPAGDLAEPAGIPPRRVIEIALGLTALGLALATVWAWRARRRHK